MPRGRRALAPDVDIRRATGGRAMPETSMRRALIAVANEDPRAVGFVARKDSGVGSLSDLSGKTIGFFRGSTSHYAVLTVLKRQGIATNQVKLLQLEPAQQVAAMMNRQIDVAATW